VFGLYSAVSFVFALKYFSVQCGFVVCNHEFEVLVFFLSSLILILISCYIRVVLYILNSFDNTGPQQGCLLSG
jgi:hypothetical protein